MKRVLLQRTESKPDRMWGTLTVGDLVLTTLERPWLDNQRMISCIPQGIYRCEWDHMNFFNKDHYQVMDVLNRDRIFFHSGNLVTDTEGCILVGMKNSNGVLAGSKAGVSLFEDALGKEPFILDIRDVP
jgi:hypothetical protein